MTARSIINQGNKLAVVRSEQSSKSGVLFCGGFKSNMEGSKALALDNICQHHKVDFTRFDYSGHGKSEGSFVSGNIDSWLSDTLAVVDSLESPQQLILVGSSMGAWIATLAALKRPGKVVGLVTIAAAPDFTERLLLPALSESQMSLLRNNQPVLMPSDYDDGSPYPITDQLIENSRQHCVLDKPVTLNIPVRMLHGTEDPDVPKDFSVALMNAITSDDVQLTLIKHGNHRLSSPDQLATLEHTLLKLIDQINRK